MKGQNYLVLEIIAESVTKLHTDAGKMSKFVEIFILMKVQSTLYAQIWISQPPKLR